jgi:hypothetical protein
LAQNSTATSFLPVNFRRRVWSAEEIFTTGATKKQAVLAWNPVTWKEI